MPNNFWVRTGAEAVPRLATAVDAAIIKGMCARGDKQSDIAAYFGCNGGRINETKKGRRFPDVEAAPLRRLPAAGPYTVVATPAAEQPLSPRQSEGGIKLERDPPPVQFVLHVTRADLAGSKCRDRNHCVLAQAVRRQFALPKGSKVNVDANRIYFPWADYLTAFYSPPPGALAYIRTFDEVGAERGEQVARNAMPLKSFVLTLIKTQKRRSPEQREQKRKSETTRRTADQAAGITRNKRRLRYAGT